MADSPEKDQGPSTLDAKSPSQTTAAHGRSSPPHSVSITMDAKDDAKDAADAHEHKVAFGDLVRVFRLGTKLDLVIYVAGLLAAMASGCTLPLMNIVLGQLIDKFQGYFLPVPTTTRDEFERESNRLALYMAGLFIARFGLTYIHKLAFRVGGMRLSSAIRLLYLQRLFAQSVHVIDSMPTGAAATTITSASNTLQMGISEKLGQFAEYAAMLVCSVVISFTYSWSLSLVVMSGLVFVVLVLVLLLPRMLMVRDHSSRAQSRATSAAGEAFSGIRMIMACGAQERTIQRFDHWSEEARRWAHKEVPLIGSVVGSIHFAIYAMYSVAFWFGIRQYLRGHVDTVGDIVVVVTSIMFMIIALERISQPVLNASKAILAAGHFFVVIDAPLPASGSLQAPHVSPTEDIVFKKVTFAYPSRPHVKILDDLDLTLEAGKITAIVGPSGSGKSTIVGLIQRWYNLEEQYRVARALDEKEQERRKKAEARAKRNEALRKKGKPIPEDSDDDDVDADVNVNASASASHRPSLDKTAAVPVRLGGTIETDGHALGDLDLRWWRSQVGLVQQEPFLFNDTIFNNVAFGLVGSEWESAAHEEKDRLVREACREAFADEFIERLPQQYETMVGESGARLSGGQRQRLAIARSIVRKPHILILDEATSAIDVRSERIVQAALDRVARNRTTITIAHRLSTIQKADRIVVLKGGRVVESGTHSSLLADENGVYAGLVRAQQLDLAVQTLAGVSGPGESEKVDGPLELDPRTNTPSDPVDAATLSKAVSHHGSSHDKSPIVPASDDVPSEKPKKDAQDTEKDQSQRGLVQSVGRLVLEQRQRWPKYAATLVFAACAGAAVPLMAFLFAETINLFVLPRDEMGDKSRFWALMWLALAFGVGLSNFLLMMSAISSAIAISGIYRVQYFRSLVYQRADFFDDDDHTVGTLTARSNGDPKELEEAMGSGLALSLSGIFTLIGSLAIAFAYGWKLSLVALFVTVPLLVFVGYWRYRHELSLTRMESEVFEESSQFASEAIGAFRTVTALTMEGHIGRRYEALLQNHVRAAIRKMLGTTVIIAFAESCTIGCQALLFYYGSRLLAAREYDMVAFFVCLMAVVQGAERSGETFGFGPTAAQATNAANRILDTRASELIDLHDAAQGLPNATDREGGGGMEIEFRGVGFRYPTREAPVFRNLDLKIGKGQFAALVGPSGCGKTSVISLLERFYEPTHGEILVDGRSTRDLNVYAYRHHLSLVAQESMLFHGTIRDNILLGVDTDALDADADGRKQLDARVEAACRDASIHDFIASLPEGYDTPLGSRGVSLSGGQKQRLSIARALIRNPQVLLLDEATSSLDSQAEKLVQAAFERAAAGRTMVVVAHRLATVQNADVIFVLGASGGGGAERGGGGEDGGAVVVESGTHAELLAQRGVYYNMCQSQALDR